MINAQQIIILTPLFNVNIPNNAMIFFGWLMRIAAMEALPVDAIYESISQVEPRPLTPTFEEIGFDHHLILNNFGTLGFAFALLPFLYLVHAFAQQCNGVRCCRRFEKSLGKQIYWGTFLRLVIEGYLIGLICCLINLQDLELDSSNKWTQANAIIACCVTPLLVLFPGISVFLMVKHRSSLEHPRMTEKFGEMTTGFNLDEKYVFLYWTLEYVRKGCLALVVVLTNEHLWLQMLTLFMLSILLIIVGGWTNARKDRFDRNMDMFNECKLIYIMYHMMLFTDFVPQPETQN
mmetsp:Transcript_13181/g.17922  ORF Transcript_13181/g.17922 Transcript_13181/m.17922 type:complete len:291 (+) Transcript_13181:2003-2875(+)